MGSHSLLQGIFPTQGLNPGLPYFRQILYCLSHQGSPLDKVSVEKVSATLQLAPCRPKLHTQDHLHLCFSPPPAMSSTNLACGRPGLCEGAGVEGCGDWGEGGLTVLPDLVASSTPPAASASPSGSGPPCLGTRGLAPPGAAYSRGWPTWRGQAAAHWVRV